MAKETDKELDERIKRLRQELQQKKRELRTAEAKRDRRKYGPPVRYINPATPKARERHELSCRLVDIGYKALAKELHPDAGGTDEEFARLARVRERLKWE